MNKTIDIEELVYLIPKGHENAKPLSAMVKLFDAYGFLDGVSDKERLTRKLIARVGIDYVVCNLSDGAGYFRPTKDDTDEFRKWLAQEEHRAKEIGRRIHKGKALFEDFIKDRCEEQSIDV